MSVILDCPDQGGRPASCDSGRTRPRWRGERLGAGPAPPEAPSVQERAMSKDKGGRAAKKPKAEKNIKTTGQTPSAGSGVVSVSTAKGKK
jgi:hypothetical protein